MTTAKKAPPKAAKAVATKPTKAEQREEKLVTALKELGGGKNKIAQALKAKKITGTPGDVEDCPIAKYVQKLFPKGQVSVDADEITVEFNDGHNVAVKPPAAVSKFIETFDDTDDDDAEGYPALKERTE